MIQIGAKGTLKRLDEMLESAMNGTFDETSYDETELSRLESRWKQYFTAQGQLVVQVKKERENIRTLVSDISHQTKTPLANILLYAELLDEKAENEEEKMLAGQIVRQTEKLQFLLKSLVKMYRLETGILELSPADGEIAPMIRETAASLQKKACLLYTSDPDRDGRLEGVTGNGQLGLAGKYSTQSRTYEPLGYEQSIRV